MGSRLQSDIHVGSIQTFWSRWEGLSFTLWRLLCHSLCPRDPGYSILEAEDRSSKPSWFHMCHLLLLQTGLALQLVKHMLRQRHVACKLPCFVTSFIKLGFNSHSLPQPCSCQPGCVCEDLLIIQCLHRESESFYSQKLQPGIPFLSLDLIGIMSGMYSVTFLACSWQILTYFYCQVFA